MNRCVRKTPFENIVLSTRVRVTTLKKLAKGHQAMWKKNGACVSSPNIHSARRFQLSPLPTVQHTSCWNRRLFFVPSSPQRGPSATTTSAPSTTSLATATRTRNATKTAAATTTAAKKNVSNHHFFRRVFVLLLLMPWVTMFNKTCQAIQSDGKKQPTICACILVANIHYQMSFIRQRLPSNPCLLYTSPSPRD